MRELGRVRTIDGEPIDYAAIPMRRFLSPPESATGLLKDYVEATAPLSVTQMSVAKAYFLVFGRAPDNSGLDYWTGVLGSGASTATAIDTIIAGTASAYVLDTDPAAFVAQVYYHLFGKVPEEDPSGQSYWTGQITGGVSRGTVVETIFNAVVGMTGYHPDTLRNRLLALESICRLQKDQNYSLSNQDSRTCVLRVVGAQLSYEEAMGDIYRLLVSRIASAPLTWAVTMSSSQFSDRARSVDNSAIRQHRYLVWYNRDGNMMLASAYLPSNFDSVSTHRGILAWHGGGWRQGYPEKMYGYLAGMATGTDPSYLVLSPTYRLTAYGYAAPDLEQDAEDFHALVKTSSFLKLDTAKIGLFGESSGGHLACYIGATQDVPRVFALYPPTDLRGDPGVSANLDPFTDYYTTTTLQQQESSPACKWNSARTTRFQLWHGTTDDLVPYSQSTAFMTVIGSKGALTTVTGEGHGFTSPVRTTLISAARSFFDERNPL